MLPNTNRNHTKHSKKPTERNLTVSELHQSWLVQRLEKPRKMPERWGLGPDNPFSFGGGLKNGGLSDDAMSLLREVFAFDYMGAAEFEFGAVPKTLQKIAEFADNGNLEAWAFSLALSSIPKGWKDPGEQKISGMVNVYVLAPTAWKDEVVKRITAWAQKKQGREFYTKEGVHLDLALRPWADDPYPTRVAGWLELDNGFMFFSDREMWEKTCELFGVKTREGSVK